MTLPYANLVEYPALLHQVQETQQFEETKEFEEAQEFEVVTVLCFEMGMQLQ